MQVRGAVAWAAVQIGPADHIRLSSRACPAVVPAKAWELPFLILLHTGTITLDSAVSDSDSAALKHFPSDDAAAWAW
jgi:hypothetical protein